MTNIGQSQPVCVALIHDWLLTNVPLCRREVPLAIMHTSLVCGLGGGEKNLCNTSLHEDGALVPDFNTSLISIDNPLQGFDGRNEEHVAKG